ncbi:MAG TPA: hypothetical protein VGI73_02945 [Solirubrobacterales bacterium]
MSSSSKKKRGGRRPRKAAPPKPAAKSSAAASTAAAPPPRAPSADERPPAPWGRAPLAELAILAGIVSLAIGIFGGNDTLIGVGVACAGLGGMEVAIREHFGGYRSHTSLLAGFAFVVVVGLLFYAFKQVLAVALPVGAACFLVAFFLLRRAFQRASGGLSYRIGGLRG